MENVKKFRKNILLVLPIEEISLQPEISTPPRFRIQGGTPERDGVRVVVVVVAGWIGWSPCHGRLLDNYKNHLSAVS